MPHRFDRRRFVAAAALIPSLAVAQTAGAQPREGRDFRLVNPAQPVETGARIEVLEFFWYGCPHCQNFEPTLEAWRKRLPADVEYRRNPVAFDDLRTPHSRIYYALEALGKTSALHSKVFVAIVTNRRPMLKPDEIADFMAANGIDRKQWLDTFNSFAVATRANRAAQVWRAYKIDGTPAVGVDGRFVTAPSMVGSLEGSVAVLNVLIERARAERGKK
jgi:thiol:disulfide interchange protein DsbA